MESRDFIDSIKAEKADALARYRRFTNITKLFQLIEVFVAVALISWSSTRLPSVFKFSGEYVSAFSSYFMNQHIVFLVGNVIVVVCYVLSRYSDSGTDSANYGIHSDDGTYSQLTHRKMNSDASNAKPTPSQVTGSSSESENQNPKSVVKSESEVAAGTAIKQAAKQIERFQRTKSDKLKSQIPVKRHRELRRSVTEMRRSMTVTSGGQESTAKSIQAVEKLSNEEFRIAVETFISKQQRFLKQQSMVEDDS
ncbi:hypothetical protein L1987_64484 [Smallanthus sonchifolius]|uniref:Uncharacterized protein n=1 Tax=Smallanthus sonchifolius TaxID=185202 RepID=A0ACB9CG74_9ASTR|nr:hypothetical protein L1987_64484 [Smallanthus sonchifolius]